MQRVEQIIVNLRNQVWKLVNEELKKFWGKINQINIFLPEFALGVNLPIDATSFELWFAACEYSEEED